MGIGCTPNEIDDFCQQGRIWISKHLGFIELDFDGPHQKESELAAAEQMLDNIDTVLLNGAKLILYKVYDTIGFNRIPDDILRHLVVARLCQPMSKMATVEYLKSHFYEDLNLNLNQIYRYLDK